MYVAGSASHYSANSIYVRGKSFGPAFGYPFGKRARDFLALGVVHGGHKLGRNAHRICVARLS